MALVAAEATAGQSGASDSSRAVPMPLHRITGEVNLDGVVDEALWEEVEPLPLIMWAPTYGDDLTERTEIRIAYNDRYLYVAGRLYDSDPDGIRSNTFYRDQFSGDDLLSIEIDSYNDYETALWFVTTPAGVRQDRTMSNDGEFSGGSFPMNADWNAHWDVATTRDDSGWFAEFRIPFSTLKFQADQDEVTMGIIVYRFIARKNERQLFPAISREWGGFGFGKPSQAQRVTLRGVRPSKPVYVTPYLLGGLQRAPVLREPQDVAAFWEFEQDPTTEPGLDIKYSPSSSLAIDLTANTDFAQVEADNQQVNLTRFSLFFPEKRQFFQERASTFEFGTGGFTDRLFFSRRIGLDRGEIVRIYGGARFVGRAGGLDYGLLNMQTAPTPRRSGENMGVLRLKQQVMNPYSFVGGMVTSRIGSNDENNLAYGLDAQLRLFGDEYLTVTWAQTFDEAVEEGSALDAGLVRASWQRRTDRGFYYDLFYRRVGPDYLPRLGFQLRKDFSQYGAWLGYSWFQGAEASLNSVTLSAFGQSIHRNVDHTPESRSIQPELSLDFKSGANIAVSSETIFEDIRSPFPVAGLTIEPGEYWYSQATVRWMLPRAALFRGMASGTAGGFYNGRRLAFSAEPRWNMSRHLEVGVGYEVNRIEFSGSQEETTIQIARLRLDFALNKHVSLSTFGQYNNVDDRTSINARFRYHFREGTDLWIVYNEGFNFERGTAAGPMLPFSAGRSLMVKYSHTFVW